MSRLMRAALAGAAIAVVASVGTLGGGAVLGAGSASAAPTTTYAPIDGSGSSWAALAIDQWIVTMASYGVTVNYTPIGSAEGREQYIGGLDDFAGSDPPFRNGDDLLAQTGPEYSKWGYSYIPDTAGGTAFMYHLVVGGKQIMNMRLTGEELMEIFTGGITNWDNPQITKTYGEQLPNIPIVPVVRTDGSGATYFFTRWMEHVFPAQWNAFCTRVTNGRIKGNCPQTEFYPTSGPGWNPKGENGSTAVADYITSSYANGAIGYDEYAYAINSHYPVVAIENPAGYFVLPTASNVAVALTQAVINEVPSSPNFLQQNLDSVYTFNDPRSYPLSSYSYLITPRLGTDEPPRFNNAKGVTLSTFVDYILCAGQQNLAQLGYSPLPLNLVKGGLLQSDHIPGHIAGPNISTMQGCDNPTFSGDELTVLKDAPEPSPCAKAGEPLDCVVVDGKATTPGASGSTGPSSSSSPGSTAPATSGDSGDNPGGAGNPAGGGGGSGGGGGGSGGTVAGTVVNVPGSSASPVVLSLLTAIAVLAAIVIPPVLGATLRRRRRQTSSWPGN
jgi:ABC-type phosphate transport system substrate-binding protein